MGDPVRAARTLRECVRIAGLPDTPFDGSALLAVLQDGRWLIEARYD